MISANCIREYNGAVLQSLEEISRWNEDIFIPELNEILEKISKWGLKVHAPQRIINRLANNGDVEWGSLFDTSLVNLVYRARSKKGRLRMLEYRITNGLITHADKILDATCRKYEVEFERAKANKWRVSKYQEKLDIARETLREYRAGKPVAICGIILSKRTEEVTDVYLVLPNKEDK